MTEHRTTFAQIFSMMRRLKSPTQIINSSVPLAKAVSKYGFTYTDTRNLILEANENGDAPLTQEDWLALHADLVRETESK